MVKNVPATRVKNFAKFTGKHLCQSFFFNEVEEHLQETTSHQRNTTIFLGLLQTEIAFLIAVGDFLESSRWTKVIVNVGVTRVRVAQPLLSGHDIDKTTYAHHIVRLFKLMTSKSL